MNARLFAGLALTGVLLVACGSKSVVGVWAPDTSTLRDDQKSDKKLADSLTKVQLEFKADGTYTATNLEGKQESGKYEIKDTTIMMTGANESEWSAVIDKDGSLIVSLSEVTLKFKKK
jgi:hypothetical protein